MRLAMLFPLLLAVPTHGFPRTKLQHWYPKYAQRWIAAAEGPCRQAVESYVTNNRATCDSSDATPCSCAADCILLNITATIQSNFASAQVLLGLVPVTLAIMGPSVAEVTVLSTYRPLLAFLLTVGSPAVNLGRAFRTIDIVEPFTRSRSAFSQLWSRWFAQQPAWVQNGFAVCTYLLALVAIYNNIRNAIDLDTRTISGWRCGAVHMPLAWSLLAFGVHGWGMIAVRVRWRRPLRCSVRNILQSDTFKAMNETKDSILSDMLFWMSSVCGMIHLIYGVFVLSALIFIGALEALQVLILFATSTVLCQLILLLEMSNMRYKFELEQSTS